jgi:mycofactocin system glycosyltransferase
VSGPLVLDHAARVFDGGRSIVGGDPPRALRLTEAGAAAARRLFAGDPPETTALATLAERLLDAGIAHPRPEPALVAEVTLIVPVRDRPRELDRCLAASEPVPTLVVDDGSRDPYAIAAVCARYGARLLRRTVAGGPSVARNAALGEVSTELVAFLDSDCVPNANWLAILCCVLSDPRVGAAAPRILPLPGASGPVAQYSAERSPLDLGPWPAMVAPGGRVAYVPSAALLARRAALGPGFDPDLRYGEDVDLVWRIHDAGWRVRYEPGATVGHSEPRSAAGLARRRFAYGTAAGPLATRHPERLAPVHLHPRPAAAIALLLARRPGAAAAVAGAHVGLTARTLHRARVPSGAAAGLALRGITDSGVAIGRAATMLIPGLLALGMTRRRSAPAALALLLAEPARSWARSPRELDPLRWTALAIGDDVAYGAGIWAGALRARSSAPLRPGIALRESRARRSRPGADAASGHPSG